MQISQFGWRIEMFREILKLFSLHKEEIMKKIAVFAAVLSVAGLVFAGGAKEASADKPLELIVAHNQTSLENPYAFAILKFKEVVEAESGGKIKVVCHHGTMGENENEHGRTSALCCFSWIYGCNRRS